VTVPGIIRVGTALVAAVLVAACAAARPSTAPAPQQPAAPTSAPVPVATPEAAVANAATTTFAAGTARFWSSTVLSGAAPESLFIHGATDFSRQLTQGEMITPQGSFRIVSDATTSYTQPQGESRWLAIPNTGAGGFTPSQQFDLLAQSVTDLRELDRTEVRGTPVRHLTMLVDLSAVPAFAGSPAEGVAEGPQPLELFVDDRGRVNRMQTTIALPEGETLTSSCDYYDFGLPVTVQIPDPRFVVQAPPG
jgi:hypothetical protein